ncbi:MAG: cytochrome b [Chromatiales bacterium]
MNDRTAAVAVAAARSAQRYTLPAIGLHWITAVLVFILFPLGWYMVDLPPGPERGANFALHKTLGITVFLLTLLRLAWRLRNPAPPLPDYLPAWQNRLAYAVHKLFYVLLIIHPLAGYTSSQFSGHTTKYLGIQLPQWGWEDKAINEFFTEIHTATSLCLLLLVLCHLAGAFGHILKRGDRLARRMLPWGRL